MNKTTEKINNVIKFITDDVWKISVKELSSTHKAFIKTLRVILIAIRGFTEDKLQLKASGLTFYTLLSVVPALAMAFGIAKGFGLEKVLEEQIRQSFEGQKEVLEWSISFANSYLKTTKGGLIAGIGLLILFWTIFKLLMNIEESFNDIWRVSGQRNYTRRFTDYLALMLIAPILMIVSSSLTVYISQFIRNATEAIDLLHYISSYIYYSLRIIPYIIIWMLLTLIYRILPNTKVKFVPALVAGIFAGTIYQLTQWLYIYFQVGVSRYNAIYGSFAALPLFLIWLQLSWLIILIGAKISYAVQNSEKYEYGSDMSRLSHSFKRLLALFVSQLLIKNLQEGMKPLNVEQIANKLDTPEHLIRATLSELIKSNLIIEAKDLSNPNEPVFQPTQDINIMTVRFIIDKLDHTGTDDILMAETPELTKLKKAMKHFNKTIENMPENVLLKDI